MLAEDADHKPHFPLLEYCTVIYLTLPYFLFWIFYFKAPYAVVFSILTIYGLYGTFFYYRHGNPSPVFSPDWSGWRRTAFILSLLVMTFVWLYLSGVGGLWYQNVDYEKHNAIFHDLTRLGWPVTYQDDSGQTYYLCYYLAYYLVPAAVGKLTNIYVGYACSFLWALTGLWLVVNWIFKLVPRQAPWIIMFFIFFSGMDVVGNMLTKAVPAGRGFFHLEWWAGFNYWQYSSNTALLNWVPQHAIGGWLTTSLLFHLLQRAEDRGSAPVPALFICSLSYLWSNFVLLGLAPIMLVLLFDHGFRRFFNPRTVVPALGILIPVTFYFLGNTYPHPHAFVWDQKDLLSLLSRYVWFCLLEFGLFCFFIFRSMRFLDTNNRTLFVVTFITLLLLPVYRFGTYNDLAMRASIPSLFILQIMLLSSWNRYSGILKTALIVILVIGAVTPLWEIGRSFKLSHLRYGLNRGLMQTHIHQSWMSAQYLGSGEAVYYKYLSRKTEAKTTAPPSITNYLKKGD